MAQEWDDIPRKVRAEVYERDGGCCRICGRWTDTPGLHHITFRSAGGLHVVENLITVGWTPGHDCHLPIAHGPQARLWAPIFATVATSPAGVTALAVARASGSPVFASPRSWRPVRGAQLGVAPR
jgi:hypothetical protein